MNKKEQLIAKFKNKGIPAGKTFLFPHDIALEIINECERLGLRIVGMDFFIVSSEGHLPVNSTDWSSIYHLPDAAKQTVAAARQLIGQKLPDNATHVEFVIDE